MKSGKVKISKKKRKSRLKKEEKTEKIYGLVWTRLDDLIQEKNK